MAINLAVAGGSNGTYADVTLSAASSDFGTSHVIAWTAKAIPQNTSGRAKTKSISSFLEYGSGSLVKRTVRMFSLEPGVSYKFTVTYTGARGGSGTLIKTVTMSNNPGNKGDISIKSVDADFVKVSFTTSPTKLRQVKVYGVDCTLSRPARPVGQDYLSRAMFSVTADGSSESGTASVLHGLTPASISGIASNDGNLFGITVGLYDLPGKRLSYKTGMYRIPLSPGMTMTLSNTDSPVVSVSYKQKHYAQRIKLYTCLAGQDYPSTPTRTITVPARQEAGTVTYNLKDLMGLYGGVVHKVRAVCECEIVSYSGKPAESVTYSTSYTAGQTIEKTITPTMSTTIRTIETTPFSITLGASPQSDRANLEAIGARISFQYKAKDAATWITVNKDTDAIPIDSDFPGEGQYTIEGLSAQTPYDLRAVIWAYSDSNKVEMSTASMTGRTLPAPTKVTILSKTISSIKFTVDVTDTVSTERVIDVYAKKSSKTEYKKVYSVTVPGGQTYPDLTLTLRYLAEDTSYDIKASVTQSGSVAESAEATARTLTQQEIDNSQYEYVWVVAKKPSEGYRRFAIAYFSPTVVEAVYVNREASKDGITWSTIEQGMSIEGSSGGSIDVDGGTIYWSSSYRLADADPFTSCQMYVRMRVYDGEKESYTDPLTIYSPGTLTVPSISSGDDAVISADTFNYFHAALQGLLYESGQLTPSQTQMIEYVKTGKAITAQQVQSFVDAYNDYFSASISFEAGDVIMASTIVAMFEDIAEAFNG